MLRELNVPVYGTALTIGLLEAKLKEAGIKDAKLHVQKQGTQFRVGKFRVELLRTCHSIPDACAIAIHTPYGVIFHTGDFKFDQTPVDGKLTDFQRIAELGYKGVLLTFFPKRRFLLRFFGLLAVLHSARHCIRPVLHCLS